MKVAPVCYLQKEPGVETTLTTLGIRLGWGCHVKEMLNGLDIDFGKDGSDGDLSLN